jgi:hypothetical protein
VRIVLISAALLLRSRASDGRILRDRVLCGLCVLMNARNRSFKMATSVDEAHYLAKGVDYHPNSLRDIVRGRGDYTRYQYAQLVRNFLARSRSSIKEAAQAFS